MDWQDLRYLLAVARAGSLSAAARELRADHATVSHRVAALEQALDVSRSSDNRGQVVTAAVPAASSAIQEGIRASVVSD